MKDLKAIAKAATTGSPLMQNREKISTDEIIRNYPDGITINGVDIITAEEEDFPVLTFQENEKKFFFGGCVLMKIVDKWMEACEGDLTALNEQLQNEGVGIRLFTGRTKNNRQVTKVEVL